MSRSFTHLRRALLGVSCAITFGFGASEVLARPRPAAAPPICQKQHQLCRNCVGQWYCAPSDYPCPPCEVVESR